MCDCYFQKCEKCALMFYIHLADFELDREEIQVFCEKHIPEENVAIQEILEAGEGAGREWKVGDRVGFRYARLVEGYNLDEFALNIGLVTKMTVIGSPIFELTEEHKERFMREIMEEQQKSDWQRAKEYWDWFPPEVRRNIFPKLYPNIISESHSHSQFGELPEVAQRAITEHISEVWEEQRRRNVLRLKALIERKEVK